MKTLKNRNTSQKVTFSVNVISFEVLLMHSDYCTSAEQERERVL